MAFQWINPKEFSFNCLLLMDLYLIRMVCMVDDERYARQMGIALANHPAVAWYCQTKAPEVAERVKALIAAAPAGCSREEIRAAECFVLDWNDWAVVYVYPEVMNRNCAYIYDWDKRRLLELTDFRDKVVLDVGAGTGRLTFAAAQEARHVYASEPCDRLREYLREKISREGIPNVSVLDGFAASLPYEDDTFDIVMSGHVVGDDYGTELAELERVVKDGGWVLDCIGENRGRAEPDQQMLRHGYEPVYYLGKTGGDIYRYRKQIHKARR